MLFYTKCAIRNKFTRVSAVDCEYFRHELLDAFLRAQTVTKTFGAARGASVLPKPPSHNGEGGPTSKNKEREWRGRVGKGSEPY